MKYIFPFIVMLLLIGCSDKSSRVAVNFPANIYKPLKSSKINQNSNDNNHSKKLIKEAVNSQKSFLMGVIDYVKEFYEDTFKQKLKVSATAYNSLEEQTDNTPNIAAWGDTLKPGMKVIAVSRDLLKMGLKYNSVVRIKGIDGVFYVKDKMSKRWQKRIDIYMGEDRQKALEWGKKDVEIMW